MVQLSVNLNKVATLRNARGGSQPDVVEAARVCFQAGAPSITVHPRADQRHIRPSDVRALGELVREHWPGMELNVEGDPRPDLLELVLEVRPHQMTLVPVRPGEITSQAGWPPETPTGALREVIQELRAAGSRVSLFVDPEPAPIRWAASMGADRVELFTEPYARAFEVGGDAIDRSLERYVRVAELAHDLGLGINAGHDLDVRNLQRFLALPHLREVSIGHALIAQALLGGLGPTVRAYLDALR